jgi:hypothetical protein
MAAIPLRAARFLQAPHVLTMGFEFDDSAGGGLWMPCRRSIIRGEKPSLVVD